MSVTKTNSYDTGVKDYLPGDSGTASLGGSQRPIGDYYVGVKSGAFDPMAFGSGQPNMSGYGVGSTPPSGEYAIFVQEAVARLVSFSSKKGDVFHAHVIFQNGSRLEFEATRKGTTLVPNSNVAQFTDQAGEIHAVSLSAVKDFSNRFQFAFADGVNMQLQFELEGRAGFEHVILSRQQPVESFSQDTRFQDQFVRRTEAWPQPQATVLHVQAMRVVSTGSSFGQGGFANFEVYLSDGHVIQLTVDSQHHDGAKYRVTEARLLSPESNTPSGKGIDITEFVRPKEGTGRNGETIAITIQGSAKKGLSQGLQVVVPLRLPDQGVGGVRYDSGARVLSVPSRKVLATAASAAPTAAPAGQVFDTRGAISLLPTPETALLMSRPPLSSEAVNLRFVGEIGGRRVTALAPLTVRGHFEGDDFVPDDTMQMVVVEALGEDDTTNYISYEVVDRGEAGYELRFVTISGTRVPVHSQLFAQLFAFGTHESDTLSRLGGLYGRQRLPIDGFRISDDFAPAADAVFAEVRRFMNNADVDWQDEDAVEVSDASPDLVRVTLSNGLGLHLRRSAEDGEISYEVLGTATGGYQVYALGLRDGRNLSIAGLWLHAAGREDEVVVPWQGAMTLNAAGSTNTLLHYQHPLVPSLQVRYDLEAGRINIHFPEVTSASERRAFVPTEDQDLDVVFENDGTERELIATLEDGNLLEITFPGDSPSNMTPIDIFDFAPADTEDAYGGEYEMTVRLLNPRGEVLAANGSIEASGNFWTIRFPASQIAGWSQRAVELVHAPGVLALRIFDIPRVAQPVAMRPDPLAPTPVPPPATAPAIPRTFPQPIAAPPTGAFRRGREAIAAGTSAPLVPVIEGFPWQAGLVLMPNEATRSQMRRINNEEDQPVAGERVVFTFEGHAPLAADRRLLVDVPMEFTDGTWQPDRAQAIVARVLASDDTEVSRDTRAVHIVRSASGWGLQIGDSAEQVLHYFRVMLTVPYGEGTATVPSPDAAFVMGDRTAASESELTRLELTTGAAALALPLDYDAPRSVATRNTAGATAEATAQFYDPLWRTSISINNNPAILELSPGLVEDRPNVRLSRLGLYDMTGVQGYFVFQQDADAVTLVAVTANGQRLPLNVAQVEDLGSGLFEYRGDLPSAYDSLAGTRVAYSLPVRIRWQVVGTAVSIVAIQIGDQPEFRPTSLRYDPAEYSVEQIRLNRQPRDVRANQRRVTPIERPTTTTTRVNGPFYLAYPLGIDGVVDGEAAVRDVLLNGRVTDGAELSENIWITYRINGDGSEARTLQMLVHYNPELQEYEPVLNRRRARLRFARAAGGFNTVDVPCDLNPRAQSQWMMTLDNGQVLYFSNWSLTQNFTSTDLASGGRPYPLLWRSGSAEPRRTRVADELARRGLTTGIPVVRVPLPDGGDRVVAVVIIGRDEYRVPLRESNHRSLTTPIPIPDNAMAEHFRDGTEMAPVPIEFFQYVPDRPGVIRFAGMEYEMQIQGRRDSNAGRRIELTRLLPGETGTATPRRIRRSLVIGPNGPSSHLLVDSDLSQSVRSQWETLQAEAPSGTNVRGLFLRRGFQDVISRERFEFVFRVERTPVGERLAFVGLARILPDNRVEVLPLTYAVIGNTCYLRLDDTGEYLSFSTRLSGSLGLQVTSSGTDLPSDILNRARWIAANPTADVFSGEVVERPSPNLPDANSNPWRDNRDTRVETRDYLSRTYGIEPWLLQRMLDTFGTEEDSEYRYSGIRLGHPEGRSGGDSDFRVLWFPVAAGRDDSTVDAIYESGMFSGVDVTRANDTRQGYIRFRIQDEPHEVMNIPFTLLQRHGLRFLVLHGPLEGVVLTESHNGWGDYYFDIRTREILERDLTGLPSVRTRGSDVYSDERPEVVAARHRHVARIRMSEFATAGVLPSHGTQDINYWLDLARLLIPDSETFTYRQTNLHRAFRLLLTAEDDWNLQGRHTDDVRACLAALQAGRLQYADFRSLIESVEIYARWRNDVDHRDMAYNQMRDELTRLADLARATTTTTPPLSSPRDQILNAPIDLAEMQDNLRTPYGNEEQSYTQQVLRPDQSTVLEPQNLLQWMSAVDGYVSGYRFVTRRGSEALAEFHRRLTALSEVQRSPTLLDVALTLEFGYRIQQGDTYNATNSAVVSAAVDRLLAWQTFLHSQMLEGQILPDAPIVSDRAQLERLVREVVIVPLALVQRQTEPNPTRPPRPPRAAAPAGTTPRPVTVAAAPFDRYDNLFGNVSTRLITPYAPPAHRAGSTELRASFTTPAGTSLNLLVDFREGEVVANITDVSIPNQERYRLPVFILADGRFFIAGRVYQVIVDPIEHLFIGLLESASLVDPSSVGVDVRRPTVVFDSESEETAQSGEFVITGVQYVEPQTDFLIGVVTIDGSLLHGNVFPYEIDLRNMTDTGHEVALVLVGRDGAADAEHAARSRGMGLVLLSGTESVDLDGAQLGAVMEQLRPLISQARALPANSLRMRRADLLLGRPDTNAALADVARLPTQLSREIYYSVAGIEIEWDLVQAALQAHDSGLAAQLAGEHMPTQSAFGAWVLVMMNQDYAAVRDIWQQLRIQGVDVLANPEALIYELLVLQTHRAIPVNVTVRDAFAVDLRQARLQDNITAPQGTEAFRQAIAAREAARRVEELARRERVVESRGRAR